jgi:hypothetical protein
MFFRIYVYVKILYYYDIIKFISIYFLVAKNIDAQAGAQKAGAQSAFAEILTVRSAPGPGRREDARFT